MKIQALTGLLVVFIAGCATRPPEPLRVDIKSPVAISQVSEQPDQYQGNIVRWGGVILSTTNLKSQTQLEIIGKNLDRSSRPIVDGKSTGRFFARVPGFLEPTEFAANREITLVGTVSGSARQSIGDYEYTYPIVDATNYYLWEERVELPDYYYDPWFYDPWYWGYPRYPWWYYY